MAGSPQAHDRGSRIPTPALDVESFGTDRRAVAQRTITVMIAKVVVPKKLCRAAMELAGEVQLDADRAVVRAHDLGVYERPFQAWKKPGIDHDVIDAPTDVPGAAFAPGVPIGVGADGVRV